ncbi:MAG: hypothetical protein HQK50_00340 [Oligoflexia bacterium]|nr:hypothetical protein [Oligoflexia bacterium]MBF0363983.1 hypothetical protein [Oligoflexia bacterium]
MKKYFLLPTLTLLFLLSSNKQAYTQGPIYTPIVSDVEQAQLNRGGTTSAQNAPPPPGGYTYDQQKTIQEYEHSGWLDRQLDKACKDNEANCLTYDDFAFSKNVDGYIEAAAKSLGTMQMMLGMMGMMSGGGMGGGSTAGETKPGANSCPGISLMLCGAPPQAAEMIGMTTQQLNSQTAQAQMSAQSSYAANGSPLKKKDMQLESLLKMKSAYQTRERTAWIQMSGWAAGTACSIATSAMATKAVAASSGALCKFQLTQSLITTALGSFLTAFYLKKAMAAKKRAELLQAVIDQFEKLIGKSNCNPISDTICYCAQPETMNDVQYCVPPAFRSRADGVAQVVSCVNNQMKNDPMCTCLSTSTCIDTIFNKFPKELQLNSGAVGPDVRSIAPVFQGKFDPAKVGMAASRLSNIGKRLLQQHTPPVLSAQLSSKQEHMAKAFEADGIPSQWARYLAAAPTHGDQAALMGKLGSASEGDLSDDDLKKLLKAGSDIASGKAIFFEAGGGRGGSGNKADNSGDPNIAELLKKLQQQKAGGDGAGAKENRHLLDIQGKVDAATKAAEINNDASRNIFEILSRRYKVSTWGRFGVVNAHP